MPVGIYFPVNDLIVGICCGFGFEGDTCIRANIENICFSVCKWQNSFSVESDGVT